MSVNTMPNVTISDTQRVVSAMAGSIVTGLVGLGALFWETHGLSLDPISFFFLLSHSTGCCQDAAAVSAGQSWEIDN